jgi:hypothetical protein
VEKARIIYRGRYECREMRQKYINGGIYGKFINSTQLKENAKG